MASIEALTEASEAAIMREIVDPGRSVTPEQYVARKRITELEASVALADRQIDNMAMVLRRCRQEVHLTDGHDLLALIDAALPVK